MLNDLSKSAIQDDVDFANLPEQYGASRPPLQPGEYIFALPPALPDGNFEKVETEEYKDRVQVKFDDAAPLEVVQSPRGLSNGEPFETRLSNVPRPRNKEKTIKASDWDYLNQALGHTQRPTSAYAYATTLQADAAARKTFAATIEWSWHCNPKREARFSDGQGGRVALQNEETGVPLTGCGKRMYQDRDVKKVPVTDEAGQVSGYEYPLYATCPTCQAEVRAFANLSRIRKV